MIWQPVRFAIFHLLDEPPSFRLELLVMEPGNVKKKKLRNLTGAGSESELTFTTLSFCTRITNIVKTNSAQEEEWNKQHAINKESFLCAHWICQGGSAQTTNALKKRDTDGVAILGAKLQKIQDFFAALETMLCLRACVPGAESCQGSSCTSYLLSRCKYQSVAPPLSRCWELHSAFSSTLLVSSRSCASCFPSSELQGGHCGADVCCRPPLVYFTAGGLLGCVSVPPVQFGIIIAPALCVCVLVLCVCACAWVCVSASLCGWCWWRLRAGAGFCC